jgi:hypothetical protein
MIPKPYRAILKPDGSSYYEFRGEDNVKDGRYYARGAVCWPVLNEVSGIAEGFAICAALSIATGTVIIFESTPFRCVDHILDSRGKVVTEGLASWFPAVWVKYNCINFYRSGNDETHHQFLMQVLKCEMIKPEPHFPEVFLCDAADAQHTLFSWRTRGKIAMPSDCRLHDDLLQWENTGRKVKLASVMALTTLVNGLERYPYQKQQEEE